MHQVCVFSALLPWSSEYLLIVFRFPRPFGYDQVSICSYWVDRFAAISRPFGYGRWNLLFRVGLASIRHTRGILHAERSANLCPSPRRRNPPS